MLEAAKRRIIERLGINRVAAHADRLQADIDALTVGTHALRDQLEGLQRRLDDESAARESLAELTIASTWAQAATPLHSPTISVVMPTRDRSSQLPTAIDSVVAQTYREWELVIVDDGSTDDTADVLARYGDPRISVTRTEGVGAAAARNVGLGAATGRYVAFLDDDNLMTPHWLGAVAEFTGRHPDCRLAYGAQVRQTGEGGQLDLLFVTPFDGERLRQHNYIDLGALVIDRTHPELRFDESLAGLIDWEMIVRAAAVTPPTPIPVVSGLYRTTAPGRISDRDGLDDLGDQLRARFAGD